MVLLIQDSYSTTFGDGLVTVKPQAVTSQNLKMIKVIDKFKSFWEWRMNFIKMHPFYSAWAAFVKGIIIGGLIVYWYFVGF